MFSESVQRAAPEGATFYRLQMKFSNGTARYYPDSKGYLIGQPPIGTPPGTYAVCYYDAAGQLLAQPEGLSVDLSLESARVGTAQMGLSLSNASGPSSLPRSSSPVSVPANERSASDPGEAGRRIVPTGAPNGSPAVSLSPDAESEIRRYQHALDLEERQQEFIKNSTYVTEVGELFALNRIMRREMVEMQRVIVQQSQQAHKDLDLMKSSLRELFTLQQEALNKAAALIPQPPPPPPPDYVGLGHTALGVLREIGVALIDHHRARGGESSSALRGASKSPQLPAADVESKNEKEAKDASPPKAAKEEAAGPDGAPPAGIVERLVHKIQSADEIELALAMCSPSKWKAFMDELLVRPASAVEKSDAPRPPEPAAPQNPTAGSEKNQEPA